MILMVLGNALLLSFIICCVVSAALQVMAWSRHAKGGVPITVKALWRPDGFFDEVGMHQIRIARRLLTIGILAYIAYGSTIVIASVTRSIS